MEKLTTLGGHECYSAKRSDGTVVIFTALSGRVDMSRSICEALVEAPIHWVGNRGYRWPIECAIEDEEILTRTRIYGDGKEIGAFNIITCSDPRASAIRAERMDKN